MRGIAAITARRHHRRHRRRHPGATPRRERCSVVRDFCGHGVGQLFHDAPNILHYGSPGAGVVLKPGMIFTVEPMINLGRPQVKILADGWTAVTRDRSLSAQFEHSVGVTETGCEIFTALAAGLSTRRRHSGAMTAASARDVRAKFPTTSSHRERAARTLPRGRRRSASRDYELLELILFQAHPARRHQADRQGAARPLRQLRRGARGARRRGSREVDGVGDKAAHHTSRSSTPPPSASLKEPVKQRPLLDSWSALIDYCRGAMAFETVEQFRILFLDKKNALIADEVQQTRHRRPHAGLSARGGQARARARPRPRSSSSTTTPPATRPRRAPTSR